MDERRNVFRKEDPRIEEALEINTYSTIEIEKASEINTYSTITEIMFKISSIT